MRKILFIFLFSLIAFCSTFVQATEVENNPEIIEVEQGGKIVVSVNIYNVRKGISAILGEIEYDEDIFEKVTEAESFKNEEGWDKIIYNDIDENEKKGTWLASNDDIATENCKLMEITFKVKDTSELGRTYIKVKNITTSDGINEYSGKDSVIDLKITEKNETNNEAFANANIRIGKIIAIEEKSEEQGTNGNNKLSPGATIVLVIIVNLAVLLVIIVVIAVKKTKK